MSTLKSQGKKAVPKKNSLNLIWWLSETCLDFWPSTCSLTLDIKDPQFSHTVLRNIKKKAVVLTDVVIMRVWSKETATYGSVTSFSWPKQCLMLNIKLSVSGKSLASTMSTSSSPCRKSPSRSFTDFRRKSSSNSRRLFRFQNFIVTPFVLMLLFYSTASTPETISLKNKQILLTKLFWRDRQNNSEVKAVVRTTAAKKCEKTLVSTQKKNLDELFV